MLKKSLKPEKKKWILHGEGDEKAPALSLSIADSLGIDPVIARLLYNRGYRTPEAAKDFLCMESELLCDPFLMNDTEIAIARIREAIEKGERITVYGDYDVDGVTAVCTLYLYLASKGALIDYYIPNRAGEGYGVSHAAVKTLAERGTKLIVTVDTGVTANEEIAYAKTLGVDVVVTDHHECLPTLPPAVAVLNPHRPDSRYPFPELAGVGVVFKLISAYEEAVSGDDRYTAVMRVCDAYADLVAIGTIADVMPIRGENRLIVAYGLRRIEQNPRVGFSALCDSVMNSRQDNGKRQKKTYKVTSSFIGYTIAPRLNAAGRIRSASLAVELFLTEDPQRASSLAEELCEANRERQAEENRIMEEAYEQIEKRHDFENDPVIVLSADHWHHGVIGIVASRITERYGLPSILVSFDGNGEDGHKDEDVGKGSGRSIKGLNLVDTLVHAKELLVKFGGHELAAGLSVTRGNLEAFKKKINDYAREQLCEEAMVQTVEADCALSPEQITMPLAEGLRVMEPYGVENPVPVFVLYGASVLEATPISAGKHTRLLLGNERYSYTAMCFSMPLSELDLFVGDRVDVMFNLDVNEWNGRKSVQLIVRDIRLSGALAAAEEKERERYLAIKNGESFTKEEDICPSREDFVAVYNLVRRSVRGGCEILTHRAILRELSDYTGHIGYVKLKFIIRILQELNLLGIDEPSEEVYHFRLQFTNSKTDLEKSNLLRRLRAQMKQA